MIMIAHLPDQGMGNSWLDFIDWLVAATGVEPRTSFTHAGQALYH